MQIAVITVEGMYPSLHWKVRLDPSVVLTYSPRLPFVGGWGWPQSAT